MAWRVIFNGRDMGAVNDETKDELLAGIRTAAQQGDTAQFGITGDGLTNIGLWTPGAPISFEEFNESDSED